MRITLPGRIPSKKNSKIMVMRGKYPMLISSPAFKAWHTEMMLRTPKLSKPIHGIEYVEIGFYLPDARKCDLSNKAESIMDLLVDRGIIVDDCWQEVPILTLAARGIDRQHPRAEVYIKTRDSN